VCHCLAALRRRSPGAGTRGAAKQCPGGGYDLEAEARPTIDWTRKTYTWGLLQGLWQTQLGK
jgi:hypothetical protein